MICTTVTNDHSMVDQTQGAESSYIQGTKSVTTERVVLFQMQGTCANRQTESRSTTNLRHSQLSLANLNRSADTSPLGPWCLKFAQCESAPSCKTELTGYVRSGSDKDDCAVVTNRLVLRVSKRLRHIGKTCRPINDSLANQLHFFVVFDKATTSFDASLDPCVNNWSLTPEPDCIASISVKHVVLLDKIHYTQGHQPARDAFVLHLELC